MKREEEARRNWWWLTSEVVGERRQGSRVAGVGEQQVATVGRVGESEVSPWWWVRVEEGEGEARGREERKNVWREREEVNPAFPFCSSARTCGDFQVSYGVGCGGACP